MGSEPTKVRASAALVVGFSVRTRNADEASPATAKIGGLWRRFYAEGLASRISPRAHPTRVMGVYTDYESNHTGAYTLVVGCPVLELPRALPSGTVSVQVPEGEYLRFTAKGPMPKALIETWGEIWRRTEERKEPARAYATDFEVHDEATPEQVEIHLSISHRSASPREEPTRRRISSGSPYEPRIGFSRAVRTGSRVLVSGTAPIWPDGSCPQDAEAQARRCFEIILAALLEAGAGPEHVVRTRMFLTSAKDADAVGRAHGAVFGNVRPAATMVVVAALLDPRWKVEIEAEAELG